MTPRDRTRLGTLIGTRSPELFTPDTDNGDSGMLAEYLLSAGWQITIRYQFTSRNYYCALSRHDVDGVSVSAPTRKEALCLAAIGLCP